MRIALYIFCFYALGALVYGASIRQPVRVQNSVQSSAVTTTTTIPLTDYVIAWEMGNTNGSDSSGNHRDLGLTLKGALNSLVDSDVIWITNHAPNSSFGSYDFTLASQVNSYPQMTNSDGILAVVTNRSYGFWFYPVDSAGYYSIVGRMGNFASGDLFIGIGSATLICWANFAGTVVRCDKLNALTSNDWNYVLVTYDFINLKNILYCNGIEVVRANMTAGLVASNNTSSFSVGSPSENFGGTTIHGSVDDVSVWDYVVSSNEGLTIYNSGAYPTNAKLAFYQFTNDIFRLPATPFAAVGTNNLFIFNGTTQQPVYTTSNSWYFDGVGSRVYANAVVPFTNNCSVSIWYQDSGVANDYEIPLQLRVNAVETMILYITKNTKSITLLDTITSHYCLTTNSAWVTGADFHNVIATLSEGTNTQIYIDGIRCLGTSQGIVAPLAAHNQISIGWRQNNTSQGFSGQLDHPKFWNRVLSGAEALTEYNKGRTMP